MNQPVPRRRSRVDFPRLAKELLSQVDSLLSQWLPGGSVIAGEYTGVSTSHGGAGDSYKVNVQTGVWAHFSGDGVGGDLTSLYAYLQGLENIEAARELIADLGLEQMCLITADVPLQTSANAQRSSAAEAATPATPPKATRTKQQDTEGWATVAPVPSGVVDPTFRHHHRQASDLIHKAVYQVANELFGYVVRFRTSDGGKDTLPYTWCTSARDGAARWHWRQWDEPRPLYLPGHRMPEGKTVVLVEGEVKAEVLQKLLDQHAPGVYCVASWPGGCKAWQKADWSWLAGCDVILWPDCDAQREPLTQAERRETPDKVAQAVIQQGKSLLPQEKQPGYKAMASIGALVRAEHGCRVQMLPIPAPGDVVSGWDCRDAIEVDGWDFARVQAFFAQAYVLPDAAAVPASKAAGGKKGEIAEAPAAAYEYDDEDEFGEYLGFLAMQMKCKVHEIPASRSMAIAALRKAPGIKECLAFDDLKGGPVARESWPWRSVPGQLIDSDDLRLGDWIQRTYRTRSFSRAALAEAMETVADERRFHPFKDWLNGLKWDGRERSDKWLIHVLGLDLETLAPKLRMYLELVGRFILLGHVSRVMQPGCKFDYSVVLEGKTGAGKSTLVEALIGTEYFSDTHFDIGNGKDGLDQLAGILAYELSEMTAFRRADSESVKAFFSSKKDRYRKAYGRFVQDHPRQCVIWCTTNKRQYLFDVTGNRRFWPVSVDRQLNVAWLIKWRAQLFAEALFKYQRGDRNYPSMEEEVMYFRPEQEKRLVETGVQGRLWDLLTRAGGAVGDNAHTTKINELTKFVTVPDLVMALGTDPGKSTALLESQIRDWLIENGWQAERESKGQRRRGYTQPSVWPPKFEDDEPADLPAEPEYASEAGDAEFAGGGDYAPI